MVVNVYALLLDSNARIIDLNKLLIKGEVPELIGELPETARVGLKIIIPNPANVTYIPPIIIKNVLDFVDAFGHPVAPVDTLDILDDGLEVLNRINKIGYSFQTLGTPFLLADHVTGQDSFEVFVQGNHLPRVELGAEFKDLRMLITLTHVTADPFYGYLGTIPHMALRCVTKEFKKKKLLAGFRLKIDYKHCDMCGLCSQVCPVDAITVDDKKSEIKINANKCIGCGYCMVLCPNKALKLENSSRKMFIEKSIDMIKAIKSVFDKHMFFINILMNIIPYPDNMPFSSTPIVENIGILASRDPVAVDKASLDLIVQKSGHDVFTHLYGVDPYEILEIAEKNGVGHTEYNLVEV